MKKTLQGLLNSIPNAEVSKMARLAFQAGVSIEDWAAELYAHKTELSLDAKRNNFMSSVNRGSLRDTTVKKLHAGLERALAAKRAPAPPPPPVEVEVSEKRIFPGVGDAPVFIQGPDPFIVDAIATVNRKLDLILSELKIGETGAIST